MERETKLLYEGTGSQREGREIAFAVCGYLLNHLIFSSKDKYGSRYQQCVDHNEKGWDL